MRNPLGDHLDSSATFKDACVACQAYIQYKAAILHAAKKAECCKPNFLQLGDCVTAASSGIDKHRRLQSSAQGQRIKSQPKRTTTQSCHSITQNNDNSTATLH